MHGDEGAEEINVPGETDIHWNFRGFFRALRLETTSPDTTESNFCILSPLWCSFMFNLALVSELMLFLKIPHPPQL